MGFQRVRDDGAAKYTHTHNAFISEGEVVKIKADGIWGQ